MLGLADLPEIPAHDLFRSESQPSVSTVMLNLAITVLIREQLLGSLELPVRLARAGDLTHGNHSTSEFDPS